ncbi:MAG: conditioned medium factor [Planctomycetota bacterium]|nr:MAG: conditioned medium factor [Planctomycetota bacterium]
MSRCLLLTTLIALCAAASPVVAQRALPSKMVAAPPSEMLAGALALPDPAASAGSSRSAWMPVRLDAQGHFDLEVPVEADGRLELLLFASQPGALRVLIAEPGGERLALDEWVARGRASQGLEDLGHLSPGARGVRSSLATEERGAWSVRVEPTRAGGAAVDVRAALMLAAPETSLRLVTQLAHWELTQSGRPALLCHLAESDSPQHVLLDASWSAALEVRDASGGTQRLRFVDDGLHADGAPNDGVFGAWLPTAVPGELDLRVIARGSAASGAFLRTQQLRLPLHATPTTLSGEVSARVSDPLHLELALGMNGAPSQDTLQVSAEVWSRSSATSAQPVAWLSTMTSSAAGAQSYGGVPSLVLSLDLRWLARAGAGGALELRNVRVQDPNTHVPLTQAEHLSVPPVFLPDAAYASPGPITAGMLSGSEQLRLSALEPSDSASWSALQAPSHPGSAPGPRAATHAEQLPGPAPDPVRALMLVHGYCSGLAWNENHFTGERIVFTDPNQSRSHDEFAQLIANTGLAADSFGIVGHSQGGSAALQLFTYYMSGLDLAVGARRIQSVGTPYQGTPLAGDLAALGDIFGAGCGTNFDLSEDGSALWLAGIPNWARAEVHYWTTSTGGFWCDFFTNFVLDNPEDGVVEQVNAQLSGANNQGHKTGWCHTTGMNDPAQYNDTTRNTEMDAQAAR